MTASLPMSDQCTPLSPSSGPVPDTGELPPVRTFHLTGQRASFWNGPEGPARLALLLELRAKKWSGSRIAAKLGVTRNMVLGKLNRLGLKCDRVYQPPRGKGRKRERERKAHPWTPRMLPQPKEPKPVGQFRLTPTKTTLAPKPIKLVDRAPDSIPATACSIYDLTNESCRYALWGDDDTERLFCGAPAADLAGGMPYCPVHSKRCYSRGGA